MRRFFHTAGEKRKFYRNLLHFGNVKQLAFVLSAFIPFALLIVGAISLIGYFKDGNAVFAFVGGASSIAGVGFLAKGKILHIISYTALALGAVQAQATKVDPNQLNLAQRDVVLRNAIEMRQQIYSQAINPATQLGDINIPLKGVGLAKRLRVIVSGTIQNTHATVAAVATPFGVQNVFSKVQLTDLNQNTRINTHGPHLANLAAVKGRFPHASALQTADFNGTAPLQSMSAQYGANYPVVANLNGLAAVTNKAFRMVYDVPLAYSDDDLRGAMFLNVLNASATLSLTLNANAFVAATPADDTFAILANGTCSYLGNLNITVYQVYLDQLPQGDKGPILPILDLSTVYELKQSTVKAIAANTDYPIPYTNFREFISTFAIYNNTGDATGHGVGADIAYWALQSANFTNIWKEDPLTVAQNVRDIMGIDLPSGMYYFSHRRKPLSTTQYGNMTLVLNALTAGANAYLNIAWEDFGNVNTLSQAGSLAGQV
jgi:hypothetical protein